MGTPDSNGESTSSDADSGNARIVDGVEVESDTGRVVAYHFSSRHPLNETDTRQIEYTRIGSLWKGTPACRMYFTFMCRTDRSSIAVCR